MGLFDNAAQVKEQSVRQIISNGSVGQTNGGDHAILFLFGHRNIPDQYRRTHLYRFNEVDNFLNEVTDSIRDGLNKPAIAAAPMPGKESAKHAIIPSANGDLMSTRALSDWWTFMLIVDHGSSSSASPFTTFGNLPTRTFYSGWISDEAATISGAQWVVNPNASMSVTHHTSISMSRSMGRQGEILIPQTTADVDFVQPHVMSQLQSNGAALYAMRPADVWGNISMGAMAGECYTTEPTAIDQATTPIEIKSELGNPTFHLQEIVSSISASVQDKVFDPAQSNVFAASSQLANTVAFNMGQAKTSPSTLLDLDPNIYHTIGELIQKYGAALDVQVVIPQVEAAYDVANDYGGAPTKRNIFSSMIQSAIASMAAQFGICDVIFRYNSWSLPDGSLNLIGPNTERGIFRVEKLGTLYSVSPAQEQHAWLQFSKYLKRTIFSIIEAEVGDFDVYVECSLIGNTLVALNIRSELPESGLLETNNLLGGLNTPLIGSKQFFDRNLTQAASLMTRTTDPNAGLTGDVTASPFGVQRPLF